MRTYLDCYPCFMKQALKAGRRTGTDQATLKSLLDDIGNLFSNIRLEMTPPEIASSIYAKISEITGDPDPFAGIKQTNIAEAQELVPELEKILAESEDELMTAVRLAVAGNVIDLGVDLEYDIVEDVKKILHMEFAVNDFHVLRREIEKADRILYLGDNSGEAVFDKLLIERLGKPVTFAVREIPVINDIGRPEARQIGIDKTAEVVSSGSTAPGTVLSLCSDEFRRMFDEADLIISKGQGNYEALSGISRTAIFLLKAKCPVISGHLGVNLGDIVIKAINYSDM